MSWREQIERQAENSWLGTALNVPSANAGWSPLFPDVRFTSLPGAGSQHWWEEDSSFTMSSENPYWVGEQPVLWGR